MWFIDTSQLTPDLPACLAYQRHARCAGMADMCGARRFRVPAATWWKVHRFGAYRYRRQAQTAATSLSCATPLRARKVLRAQPHAEAKGGGILHCAHRDAGIGERRIGLAERYAAGTGSSAISFVPFLSAVGQRTGR
jgi:hypothetical protein